MEQAEEFCMVRDGYGVLDSEKEWEQRLGNGHLALKITSTNRKFSTYRV